MSNKIKNDDQLALQILSYLADNPKAEDTLEGIVDWWLLQQRIEFAVVEVKKALSHLITQNFVQEISGPGKHNLYRINPDMHTEIRNILDSIGGQ